MIFRIGQFYILRVQTPNKCLSITLVVVIDRGLVNVEGVSLRYG